MTGLSNRETRVLDYLRRQITETHCPSYSEIGRCADLSSKSQVSGVLHSLANKGWLKLTTYGRRSIQLADPLANRSTADLLAMRQRIDAILGGRAT